MSRATLAIVLFALPLAAAPVPRAEQHDGLLCLAVVSPTSDARILLFTPDGKPAKEVKLPEQVVCGPALSRDASRVAVFIPTDEATVKARALDRFGWPHGRVVVYDLAKPEKPRAEVADLFNPHYVWSPNGKTLYVSTCDETVPRKAEGWEVYPWQAAAVDVATGKKTPLKLPQGHVVVTALPDNDTLFTGQEVVGKGGQWVVKSHLVPLATMKPELMTEKTRPPGVPAVDDLAFATKPGGSAGEPRMFDPNRIEVRMWSQDKLKLGNDTARVQEVRHSPDRKKVLVHRVVKMLTPGRGGATEKRVPEAAVREADGTNPQVVYVLKAGEIVSGIDWK